VLRDGAGAIYIEREREERERERGREFRGRGEEERRGEERREEKRRRQGRNITCARSSPDRAVGQEKSP
jgi:hypothetical protein